MAISISRNLRSRLRNFLKALIGFAGLKFLKISKLLKTRTRLRHHCLKRVDFISPKYLAKEEHQLLDMTPYDIVNLVL